MGKVDFNHSIVALNNKDGIKLLKEPELPPGILSFNDFCKENGISTGLLDHDLMARNYNKAKEKYNAYLMQNNVEPPLSIFERLKTKTSSLPPDCTKSLLC